MPSTAEEKHFVDEWIKKNLSPESDWTNSKYMEGRINEDRNAINPDPAYWHNIEINNIKRLKNGLLMMSHTKAGMLLLESIQQNLAQLGAKMKVSVVSDEMGVIPIADLDA